MFSSSIFSYTNAINLKALRAKANEEFNNGHIKKVGPKINTVKKDNPKDNNILKVKNIEIDEKFYNIYKGKVDEKLKLYNEYIKEKDEEKKKAMEAKYNYLKRLRKQVKEIKSLLKKDDFLYMWNIYLPHNSNLIFFKYNETLYFIPAFTTKIETTKNLIDVNKFVDQKYKKLKEFYKTDSINIIKDKKDFDYLNNEFWLISFDSIKDWLNIFSDADANIVMYPTDALIEALKEKWIKYKTNWIFTFFILNNYNDTMAYKSHYLKSTIKLISDYFMNVWQNNIWINWYTNSFGYKEILLPLRVIKKQRITVIKPKSLSIFDMLAFIFILIWGGVWIYLWLKKMFNIYNDLE